MGIKTKENKEKERIEITFTEKVNISEKKRK